MGTQIPLGMHWKFQGNDPKYFWSITISEEVTRDMNKEFLYHFRSRIHLEINLP